MDTGMKSLSALTPRSAVLDGTADFVVNLADLGALTEDEAREFLDSNVLTSGMELLLSQAFARMAGLGNPSGIYKLSESMGGGKTQTEIVAGILARFPHLAHLLAFREPLPKVMPDVVAAFTGRSTDKKVWVSVGEALGVGFSPDRAPSETEWRDALKDRSALRTLMENAKRTATDFLVPPAMDRAIKKAGGGDPYQFWRQFSPEEKFILKGLEGEAQGVFKLGAFQDLGRAYGLADYESLLGPTRANDTRTILPAELPRPDAARYDEVPASDRPLWRHSPTRHIYHGLKLLQAGADVDRAAKHLADCTDFQNLRGNRLLAILSYLQEITATNPHWGAYRNALEQLAIGVEHYRG
jgi:hypothetical protein